MNLGDFESCMHEKGSRNHPFSDAAKERNLIKSAIRACVEQVFVCMTILFGLRGARPGGVSRPFNFLRYLLRADRVSAFE